MTIAGGMVCADGVLLYADTEWTATTLKIQRPKHWRIGISDGSLHAAIAGAGDQDYVRLATQKLQGQLLHRLSNGESLTTKAVFDELEAVTDFIYKKHIYPDPNGGGQHFGLVVAVSDAVEKKPVLFKTAGTSVIASDRYEYVYLGSGAEFASYLTQKLFCDKMPLDVAIYLASYVLWQTKQHVKYCGGESVIYVLRNDGTMGWLNYGEIRDYESHFDDFDRLIQRLRLQSVNPDLKEKEFDKILSDFSRDAKLFYAARKVKNAAEKKIDAERSKLSASRKSESEP